jgi:hypothetical protein
MAFKNYGRDRAERATAARARSEEKKRKRDEKTALRNVGSCGGLTDCLSVGHIILLPFDVVGRRH